MASVLYHISRPLPLNFVIISCKKLLSIALLCFQLALISSLWQLYSYFHTSLIMITIPLFPFCSPGFLQLLPCLDQGLAFFSSSRNKDLRDCHPVLFSINFLLHQLMPFCFHSHYHHFHFFYLYLASTTIVIELLTEIRRKSKSY